MDSNGSSLQLRQMDQSSVYQRHTIALKLDKIEKLI